MSSKRVFKSLSGLLEKMPFALVVFLSFWGAVSNTAFDDLELKADKPLVRVALYNEVNISCCYSWKNIPDQVIWIMSLNTNNNGTVTKLANLNDSVTKDVKDGVTCHWLMFRNVSIKDTGLYQCRLNSSSFHIFTHGTFLQVYKPLQKTLNLSESVKNSIITAEGVLLLMCVLIPGTMILCKSKRLKELERKKGREEENIYEGLNLDDCNSAYHQIQRTSQQGPYQDVANCAEDIQLEKP